MNEPAKLLILDDDKEILESFSFLMRSYKGKYEADFFNNPQEALNAVMNDPQAYDLVLTDIQMPEMDGVSFVKTIRDSVPGMPIIFMTGFTSEESKRDATAIENVVFLEKPFLLRDILDNTIPSLLRG